MARRVPDLAAIRSDVGPMTPHHRLRYYVDVLCDEVVRLRKLIVTARAAVIDDGTGATKAYVVEDPWREG